SVGEQPKNTNVKVLMRTGSSPDPRDKSWTTWTATEQEKFYLLAVHWLKDKAVDHRWAQIKLELSTERPQQTPSISAKATLTVDAVPEKSASATAKLKSNPPLPPLTGVPFVYEGPSPRLKFLREKYKLDAVIAPGKTEMEQLMLLRYWIRNQWHTAW